MCPQKDFPVISPVLGARFREALVFASQLHAHQVRKASQTPYISHLLSAAAIVIQFGGNEDEAIAALLHDAIEDQGGNHTRQKIRGLFGDRVVEIVNGCTDSDTDPKPPWQERKIVYLNHLRSTSPSIRLVVAADKLHNARSILIDYRTLGDELWQRFTGKKEGTLWYYNSIAEVFQTFGPHPLFEELIRVIDRIDDLAAVKP
jgi:(p)ppGpp synthase/HD superfamily hydrolase